MPLPSIDIFKAHILNNKPYRGGSTREHGSKILYKLSSNENLLGPSPKAMEAIVANVHRIGEYSYENDIVLRQAIAREFEETIAIDQLITANSGMELLDMIVRGFISPGEEVIISSPTFMAYKSFAALGGAVVKDVPLLSPDYDLDVVGILQAVSWKTKLVFISNPNNPTGSLVSKAQMDVLLAGLPPHVVVVYDEVYHHYVESSDYPRAADYILQGYPVIGIHSFSKAYGLAGLRVGYAFSTPEIGQYLQHIQRPFMINTLTTVAAVAALGDREHLHKTRHLNSSGKVRLYNGLDLACIPFHSTDANFILACPPAGPDAFVEALQERGIMVRNASVMKAHGCVRITIGHPAANQYFCEQLKGLPVHAH